MVRGVLGRQAGWGFAKNKEHNKQKERPPTQQKQQSPVKQAKQKGTVGKEPVNWQKYGLEVSQIFSSNRVVTDLDVAFIAKQVENR